MPHPSLALLFRSSCAKQPTKHHLGSLPWQNHRKQPLNSILKVIVSSYILQFSITTLFQTTNLKKVLQFSNKLSPFSTLFTKTIQQQGTKKVSRTRRVQLTTIIWVLQITC
jgi:hypothetical protein